MNIYKVFSKNKAFKLIDLGNRLIYTEPNRKKNWLSVFCFEETDKLHKDWNK